MYPACSQSARRNYEIRDVPRAETSSESVESIFHPVSASFLLSSFNWHVRGCFAYATDIEKFLSGRDVSLSQESPNPGGGNYGDIEVLDKIVRFSSGNRYMRFYPVPNGSNHKT